MASFPNSRREALSRNGKSDVNILISSVLKQTFKFLLTVIIQLKIDFCICTAVNKVYFQCAFCLFYDVLDDAYLPGGFLGAGI